MGMLEDVLGSVLGSQERGGGVQGGGIQGGLPGGLDGMLGGNGRGSMSPIAVALMALLTQQMSGRGGGLGELLGGLTGRVGGMGQSGGSVGTRQPDTDEPAPEGGGYAVDTGLDGILKRLEQVGHGRKAQSWVGHGDNQPIAPDELRQALGDDTIDRLSTKSGLPDGDLLSQLSQVLPGVIDKLTPNGRLPNQKELSSW